MDGNKRNLYILAANSCAAYVLSYIAIFIPSQFLTALVAKSYHVPITLNFFKIAFGANDYSALWTENSVIAVYISAPLFILFIGFLFYRYTKKSDFRSISYKLFFIWGYAHCLNIFFGGLIVGIPLVKGFGYVPIWLYLPEYALVSLIIISVIILFFNGFMLRRSFISVSFSEDYLSKMTFSFNFKFYIVILPCILVNLIFLFVNFPDNSPYEKFLLATMLIQLPGVLPYQYFHYEIKDQNRVVSLSKSMTLSLLLVFLIALTWRILER